MSTTSSGEFKFDCWFDHGYKPCPGHTLEIREHNTSDTVSVFIDGENRLCVDDGTWNAMLDAIACLKLYHQGKWQEARALREQVNEKGRHSSHRS